MMFLSGVFNEAVQRHLIDRIALTKQAQKNESRILSCWLSMCRGFKLLRGVQVNSRKIRVLEVV